MNAKELLLSKINAGPELAGTYIYMLLNGVSFDLIAEFMTSTTLDAIVEKSKSNIFKSQKSSLNSAVKYYLSGEDIRNHLNQDLLDSVLSRLAIQDELLLNILTPEQRAEFLYEGKYQAKTGSNMPNNAFIFGDEYEVITYDKYKRPSQNILKYFGMLTTDQLFLTVLALSKSTEGVNTAEVNYLVGLFSDKINNNDLRNIKFKLIYTNTLQGKTSTKDAAVFSNSNVFSNGRYYDAKKAFAKAQEGGRDYEFLHGEKHGDCFSKKPLVRFLESVIQRRLDIDSGKVDLKVVEAFSEIYEDALDLKVLGTRLGINQGMGTKFYDSYKYDESFRLYIYKKASRLPLQELSALINDHGLYLIDPNNLYASLKIEELHNYNFKNKGTEYYESVEYQKQLLAFLDALKTKVNIIQIERGVSHYDSMIYTQTTANLIFNHTHRMKKTREILQALKTDKTPMGDSADVRINPETFFTELQVGVVSSYLVSQMVNEYFKKGPSVSFKVKKGDFYYNEDFDLVEAENDHQLNLKTTNGMMSFKLMMDLNYKNFVVDSQFANNYFLLSLVMDSQKDSMTDAEVDYLRLNQDMNNINTEFDALQFLLLLSSFNELRNVNFEGLSISIDGTTGSRFDGTFADAFFIYNLLVNNNAFGRNSMTKIFEASILSDMGNDFLLKKNLIAGYMKFVGDVDAGNIQMPDVNLDTIAMLISEKMTNFSSAKYVRKWNNKLKQNELYQKVFKTEGQGEFAFLKSEYLKVADLRSYANINSKLYAYDKASFLQEQFNPATIKKVKSELTSNLIAQYNSRIIYIKTKC